MVSAQRRAMNSLINGHPDFLRRRHDLLHARQVRAVADPEHLLDLDLEPACAGEKV